MSATTSDTSVNRDHPFPISLCTVYRIGPKALRLVLGLLGVFQDTLSLQSSTGLLKSPGLYATGRVSIDSPRFGYDVLVLRQERYLNVSNRGEERIRTRYRA